MGALSRNFLLLLVTLVGVGVIAVGFSLLFVEERDEFRFQYALLGKFNTDFKWHVLGSYYPGVVAVAIGALMMGCAALLACTSCADPGRFNPDRDW